MGGQQSHVFITDEDLAMMIVMKQVLERNSSALYMKHSQEGIKKSGCEIVYRS